MHVPEALFEPLGRGRYRTTELAQGPWDPGAQHGSPPAALLAGSFEAEHPRPDLVPTRFTMDLFGPVPMGELEVRTRVARDGRRIQALDGELLSGGRVAARARAWRVRRADTADIASPTPPPPAEIPADTAPPPSGTGDFGYFSALDWRFAAGGFRTPGPATAWLRLRVPVVAGREPTPIERVMGVVDCSSGVSNELDFASYVFTNVDLTVHLHRPLAGEWVCTDAKTTIGDEGAGLCRATLSDEKGGLGGSAQTLFIGPR
ncbi:MAG: thioesterase family protein [Streptosporangiales bacterium]|nr:thioesterase family protein [Streptosporangiales bacterium]